MTTSEGFMKQIESRLYRIPPASERMNSALSAIFLYMMDIRSASVLPDNRRIRELFAERAEVVLLASLDELVQGPRPAAAAAGLELPEIPPTEPALPEIPAFRPVSPVQPKPRKKK